MDARAIDRAADLLWRTWMTPARIEALPVECRPRDRGDGYEIQAAVVGLSGQRVAGWKIAATSHAGQRHINVDGPLAGPLLDRRALLPGMTVSLEDNHMRAAEAEFAFRFGKPLPARAEPYTSDEVLAAVASLHPAIEVPDSRYFDFTKVGAAQLIADCACACWYRIGHVVEANWRADDLVHHAVTARKNGEVVGTGSGANVLGDPRVALTWLVNELSTHGRGIAANDVVMTGTCLVPVTVSPGDHVRMDFGAYGAVEVSFA
jgi:2-keto-4-pentenoate hydratase